MPTQIATRRVALAYSFLDAWSMLPSNVRARVQTRLNQFYENPAHPSLNYETIKNAMDPRMRSMRVTDDYRIIVAHPNGNGTYLLLWVDKHDAAYDWAMRHRLDPGDEQRGLAIVPGAERGAEGAGDVPITPSVSAPPDSVLRECADAQLAEAGVPAAFVPVLRACASEDALLDVLKGLREEVAEAVMCLAVGEPLPATLREVAEVDQPAALPDTREAEPDPIEVALYKPESSRRFVVLSSQRELEQALNYPMERWRLFLHPDQRGIVRRHFSGPALVSGGAGTGKTVVGLHRAYYLATEVFTAPNDHVLLTTFTRNLALNLKDLMDSLCGRDTATRNRIEVTHVHSLAAQLLRRAGERFDIADGEWPARLMTTAVQRHDVLGLPASFYLAEWEEVVQEREALSEPEYLQANRSGRGKALNRRQRADIWPVLDAYRAALAEAGREDWSMVVRRARHLVESGRLSPSHTFRAAIVDEAQDMGAQEMRLLLTLVGQGPNSLLLLGDTRQQIYARGSYVPLLGIQIGRRHVRLRLNYRTTAQIHEAAAKVAGTARALNGESIGRDDSISLLSGPSPTVQAFATETAEQQAVAVAIRQALGTMPAEGIAVVARSTATVKRYQKYLSAEGIPIAVLDAEGARASGVQLGTMHRGKGLEFSAVFVVDCSADEIPRPFAGEDEPAAMEDHIERERHLLYVAMTRAREQLWISGVSPLSPLLDAVV